MAKMGETGVKSEPSGVIGGAKPAHKVGNLKSEPSGVIGGAKPEHKVGNLKSELSGVIGEPCWWSLTYFGGLEYVFLVLSAGNAWGTLDSNIPSVRDAHPTPPSLYQGECHKHL